MKKPLLFFLLPLGLFGCETQPAHLLGAPAMTAVPKATEEKALVAHEWGTYTSVQSSIGETMIGLQHTEEALPVFVHQRDPAFGTQKGIESIPEPVNQKLETPVIYFYTKTPRTVSVSVDFPKGIVSEWYPGAKSFQPAVGQLQAIARGSMSWEAHVFPSDEGIRIPAVSSDSIWAPSRNVKSAGVVIGGEAERFIFYRGLGRFEMPLHVSAQSGGDITLHNDSEQIVPAAFLLIVDEAGGSVQEIGPVTAHGAAIRATSDRKPMDAYVAEASTRVAEALEASGLSKDESRAMVDTWTRSYFQNPGTRVLYLAPRDWTDALLPIHIDPAPDELVRTLVGRIELMTPEEEQRIVGDVTAAAKRNAAGFGGGAYGRFLEPKLRRAVQLIADPEVKAFAQNLVEAAAGAP